MDTCEEIIPQRVDPENKPSVAGQRRRCPASISAALSKVLDDDDLLIEILLRVGFPTTLVCAALVCKRWFYHISDNAFLRRFRELHPPRLLGFYVNPDKVWERPRFIPMAPQLPELATVIHRASSSFDTYQSDRAWTHIIDCRKGCVFMEHHDTTFRSTLEVRNLLFPERGMVAVPKFPCDFNNFFSKCEVLSKEEKGCLSYFCVSIKCTTATNPAVFIYRLQDGIWCMHNLPIELGPHPRCGPKSALVGNKIYMAAACNSIIVLDLIASTFSTIRLPQGVEHGDRNTILSCAVDADSVYLIHVKQLLLSIWLYNVDDWLLVQTICLREMCANLNKVDCNASIRINQVGDNAEFVFLEMGQWILYLDIKCGTLRKVNDMTSWNPLRRFRDIYPLMMIWPPTFPTLKCDHERFASWTLDDLRILCSC